MKNPFNIGDKKYYQKVVHENDVATFESGEVHPFYGTFALARDAEWSSRLFVLEIREADEEGIGTFVNINHLSPAVVGDEVSFTAMLTKVYKNEVVCEIEVRVGDRLIAKGKTGQKVIKRVKLDTLYKSLKKK